MSVATDISNCLEKKGTYDLNAAGVVNGTKVYQRLLIRRVTKE